VAPKFADAVFGSDAGGEPTPADDAAPADDTGSESDKENGRMLASALKNGDNAAIAESVRRCCGM